MNEDVTAANSLQKDQIGGVVEETRVVPGDEPLAVKDEAQGKMSDTTVFG